jgi:hypothetical protein
MLIALGVCSSVVLAHAFLRQRSNKSKLAAAIGGIDADNAGNMVSSLAQEAHSILHSEEKVSEITKFSFIFEEANYN